MAAMDLITRAQWGARAWREPNGSITYAGQPRGVKIHWLGTPYSDRPHDKCAAYVRGIQAQHMDGRGWSDVGYSFLVCEHGSVYEGRGLRRRNAANGNTSLNEAHYAVCGLVGSSGLTRPTDRQLHGLRDAIEYCRRDGPAGAEIRGHRDGYATACPGDRLYAWVREGAPRPMETTVALSDDEMRRLADVMWERMPDHSAGRIARAVWTLPINHPFTDGKISPAALERGTHHKVARSEGKIGRLLAAGAARDVVLAQLVEALAARDGAVDVDALLERISEQMAQVSERIAAELARIEVEVRVADETDSEG